MDVREPLSADWPDEQVEVMNRLRDWALGFAVLNSHLSSWMGLSTTDANALGHLVWAAERSEPLSPAQLSARIGMTSGATTTLLGRLESAGYVRRDTDPSDRRRRVITPTASARDRTQSFLHMAGSEIAATLQSTSLRDARVIADFLTRMTDAADEANARLSARAR